MSSHTFSIFTNSCVKPPVNPLNQQPLPLFERPLSFLDAEMSNLKINQGKSKSKSSVYNCSLDDFYDSRSLVDFYDSIPDYNEVNHLTEAEFYAKLQALKETCFKLKHSSMSMHSLDECNNYTEKFNDISTSKKVKSASRLSFLDSAANPKSPLGYDSKNFSKFKNDFETDNTDLSPHKVTTRSKSVSPIRTSNGLTIPKPFKMTQRDDEERMLNELQFRERCSSLGSRRRPRERTFKANPVPLTSKIPLFNQIMEDQKLRSEVVKLNSALELQSKIRPFNFSERTNSRCYSSTISDRDANLKQEISFKAKPCPKNLFSSYFHNKMWEDEYFRTINKKIRAEELLKLASLPPSMAKRDKNRKSPSETTSQSSSAKKKKKKSKKTLKTMKRPSSSSFLCPVQTNIDTDKTKSSSDRSTTVCGTSPLPVYPVSRPNLAEKLRIESGRKKAEQLKKPDSSCETVRRVDWGVKRTPAWKTLSFNETNEEDISYRLATRRAEQRLREEEYATYMEMMRQRVKAAPLLLEGQTYWGPKVGQLSHSCGRDSRQYYRSLRRNKKKDRCCHKDENYHPMSGYNEIKKNLKSKISKYHHTDSDDLGSEDRAYL